MQGSRAGIAFLVAIVVALQPQAAVSQTDAPVPDIDGHYNASMTVQDTCEIGPHRGYRQAADLEVRRVGTSELVLAFKGARVRGTITSHLSWDYTQGRETGEGRFVVEGDGSVTMTGTIRHPFCTGALGAAGDVVWRLRGYRKAPEDFDPLASSPTPSSRERSGGENPGAVLATDSFEKLCPTSLMGVPNECQDALVYATDWSTAMDADVRSLRPKGAVSKALNRLMSLIFFGAYMGAMTVYDECTGQDVPAFPIAKGLLKVFGKSFIEGMAAAAKGDAAAVDRITDLVDRLLFQIAIVHPKPVGGGPCPSPSPS